MKKVLALFLTMLLLMSIAFADLAVQAPPELHLVSDDISFATSTGNYDWTYPTDTPDEWCGVEACGMAPTDPYVFENIEHLFLIDETEFTLDWGDNSPDKVEVIGWENAVFQDVEHAGDYQDTYLELTDWKVVLKPDHVYSIGARWLESEEEKVSHGSAFYYIVTESTAEEKKNVAIEKDGDTTVKIDGVVYYNTQKAIPVEPDESVIVNEELLLDGSVTNEKITAYAFINDEQLGNILVCLIDGEWYQFIATERVGQP